MSEKALARLSGIDLVYALDVENKGTVDPVVLKRSLLRFDKDVFTEECIDGILQAFGSSGGGTATAPLVLNKLVEFVVNGAWEGPRPQQNAVLFPDPRYDPTELSCPQTGVIGFYFPGHNEPCDTLCGAPFLGNFWEMGADALQVTAYSQKKLFTNSESAFQALKFWGRADEFRTLSGNQAFHLKRQLQGGEDFTYGGHGGNWQGMMAVLRSKFAPGSPLAEALRQTGSAFLLEHNSVSGRDKIWSDNHVGDGKNWLGMQIMIIRDELFDPSLPWTKFLSGTCQIDISTGHCLSPNGEAKWQSTVFAANQALIASLPAQKAAPECARPGCTRAAWNGKKGEYCGRTCKRQAEAENASSNVEAVTCARPGCNRPTWNGQEGEYCGRWCKSRALTETEQPISRPTTAGTAVTQTPRAPLVPQSPACDKHAAVLDEFFDGTMEAKAKVRQEFRELVDAPSDEVPEDLSVLKAQLMQKAKDEMLAAQRANIGPVWEAFDVNKDGTLSTQECTKLVAAYLRAFVPKAPEVVRSAIELGVELQVVMFERTTTDPELRQRTRELAKKQVEAVVAEVGPIVQRTLEQMANEDPGSIAAELANDLDANKDGRVTREEFENRFVEAMQQLLGPERMMDKLQCPPES